MSLKTNTKNNKTIASYGKIIFQRILSTITTLVVIAYLTIFVLILAERGRDHLPAQPLQSAGNAISRLVTFFFDHPLTYLWHRQDIGAFQFVLDTFLNSAGLLIVSIVFAAAVGVLLGLAAALSKGRVGSSLVLIFSVFGMSTPSFLFAMLLWIFNIQIIQYKLGLKALPPTGIGWDLHLIMPALVLAARPLAQIAQVTYISLRDVLGEDYIRTARSKGLSNRLIYFRHAFRNIQIPVLTTIGTSIRYAIASLPVVEFFFLWPGIGLTLLQAIELGYTNLVMDLILALGLFFIVFNLILDFIYPLLDARLRKDGTSSEISDAVRLRDLWNGLWETVTGLVTDILVFLKITKRKKNHLPPLSSHFSQKEGEAPAIGSVKWKQWFGWIINNPALIIGFVLVLGLAGVMLFGQQLTSANPYEMNGVMKVDGVIGAPPFAPSNTFPWGTDHLGRDMMALVLTGGQRTLTLALLVMAARMVVGAFLGVIAGWWQGGLFDRLITRLLNIWAAFPITIFAMLLIQAIGIQQGTWVFVVALCIVGWGEVTQFVRSQTLRIKPQLFVEASRSLGASAGGILIRQVFPNLVASLIVIASLEMGGILMLLAELGFLNIFLGGGFQVEFAVGQWVMFSDIPEWGSLLANIRDWWRSYPWMAWYPGLAFFIAIMTFNLFAEGLRRFLEDSRVNLSRLFNRYTFLSLVIIGLAIMWVTQSQSPLGRYRSVARQFDSERVFEDIEGVLNPAFNGRESGTPDDLAIATYLGQQMEKIGLFPAASDGNYVHAVRTSRLHVLETPALVIETQDSGLKKDLVYREDFVDFGGPGETYGEALGSVIGLAYGPGDEKAILQNLSGLTLLDKALIIRAEDYGKAGLNNAALILVITSDEKIFTQKKLYFTPFYRGNPTPTFWISETTANELLSSCGSSLSQFKQEANNLEAGQIYITEPGVTVSGSIILEERLDDEYHVVVGVLPGEGAAVMQNGHALDNEVTVVSAYYDGLGSKPDGIIYPGANDNASGVAVLFETARQLLDSPYAPSRTVVFILWSGAERGEPFAVNDTMGSINGLSDFILNEIVEISGVGAGSGKGISLGGDSSYRLVKLAQQAADRLNIPTTTRGRGPHYGIVPEAPVRLSRNVPSLYFSWDGADETAHTLEDNLLSLDSEKLTKSGQLITLILLVLSRELNY